MTKCTIINSREYATQPDDFVVVIDVFRAFSVSCYLANNPETIILAVDSLKNAQYLITENPTAITLGEMQGRKIESFDYGNSPLQICDSDFSGRTIVQLTSCGTKSLVAVSAAEEVITASVVNAEAVITYIKQKNPHKVVLLCTNKSHPKDNEDRRLASYMRDRLQGKSVAVQEYIGSLQHHECSRGFFDPTVEFLPEQDYWLCMKPNIFDFVLKAEPSITHVYLRKISIPQ